MWEIKCPDRKERLTADALTLITDGKEIYYLCDVCHGIHNIIKNPKKVLNNGNQKCGIEDRRNGDEQIDLQEQVGKYQLQSPHCNAGCICTATSGSKSRKIQQH